MKITSKKFPIIIVATMLAYSCVKTKVIFQEKYNIDEQLVFHHFYATNCISPSIFYYKCDNIIGDSLWSTFKSNFEKLNLEANYADSVKNQYSNDIWKNKKRKEYHVHNKLDADFIKHSIPDLSNATYIIPIIHNNDTYIASEAGIQYYVSLGISIFIIRNGSIIYQMGSRKRTKSVFYVREDELDKSQMGIDKLWEEVVKEVMQPYMERLK